MSKKELREMKEKIEEAKERGEFNKLRTTSSVSPRMTQTQALSEDNDIN